ncbi:hypothetical protein E3P86_00455 [Wallemia ichthyophaga]|uniref:Uncharacterized protein n=1 Tax=Wallemia ichthyophaga TaxID=245174 RepID=A0A4T0JJ33_WALIC|nr:hypothetical protein E3P86_00455 [Wallemia ichthyophaga]
MPTQTPTKKTPPVYTSLYRTTPAPSALHLPTLAAVVAYGEYLEKDWTPAQALKWFKVDGDWAEATHWRGEAPVGAKADGRLGRLISRCIGPAQQLRGLDLSLPSVYLPPSLFANLPNSLTHLSLNGLSWRFNLSSLLPPKSDSLTLLTSLNLSNLPSISSDALTLVLRRNTSLQSLRLVNVNLTDTHSTSNHSFLADRNTSLSEIRFLELRNVMWTSPHGLFHLIHPSRNLHTLILNGSFPPSRNPRIPPTLDGADDTTSMPFRAYFMHFLPLFPHLSRLEIDNKLWGKDRDGLGLVEVLGLGADVGPPSDWQRWEVEEAWKPTQFDPECGVDEDREWVMAEGGKWVWVSDAEPMDDSDDDDENDEDDDDNMIDDDIYDNEMLPPPASSALRRSTAKLFASLQESTTRSLEAAFAAPPAADGDLLRDGEAFCGVVLDRVEEEVRRMRDFVRRGGVRAGQQKRQFQQQQQYLHSGDSNSNSNSNTNNTNSEHSHVDSVANVTNGVGNMQVTT